MRPFVNSMVVSLTLLSLVSCAPTQGTSESAGFSEAEIENIVRRSYQYVSMFNVINKGAMMDENPMRTGWNGTFAAAMLMDHTMQAIARPNNDTPHVATGLDLRAEPVVVSYPAFDSKYVALESSAYDHYVDIPLSTTKGDFAAPTTVLYYTQRTEGYAGEPVEGVDIIHEMTGDFCGAFLRVLPHAAEPERMQRNLAAMQEVRARTLSEFLGQLAKPVAGPGFPAFNTGTGIYQSNSLEVMQFLFNHTTFDPTDEMDLGVPGGHENPRCGAGHRF